MIKKLIFFLVVLSTLQLFGQEKHSPIFIEHNSIIVDSQQVELISFRIPYKNLLFVKDGDEYHSSFTLTFEFFIKEEFVTREIITPQIFTSNYIETQMVDKCYQDFIMVTVDTGKYNLKANLTLGETDLIYKIPPKNIPVVSIDEENIFGPLIVDSEKIGEEFKLSNFGNKIPYTPHKFNLLLGIRNLPDDTIHVKLDQNKKVILEKNFSRISTGTIVPRKHNDDILLMISDTSDIKYFLINEFSHQLYEGLTKLEIAYDTNNVEYSLITNWNGKPRILNNPEYSIKLLSYIEEEEVVSELLSSDDEDYYKNLTEYWIENYPANGMKYNYAMEEYYRRADFAVKNYSSLSAFDGAERDRGQVYILYGEPSSIERNYTEINEVVEVWKYEKLARTFVFKDVNGTGKFDLTK